jgi:hypothetical protein
VAIVFRESGFGQDQVQGKELDATGLKVFSRGEWAAAKHGAGCKEPGWRKRHLAVDDTGKVVAAKLTESEVADAMAALDRIDAVGGDRQWRVDTGRGRRMATSSRCLPGARSSTDCSSSERRSQSRYETERRRTDLRAHDSAVHQRQ